MGIFCVLVKPGSGTPKAKTVAPGVHVGHQSISSDAADLIGQQNLQKTDGGLLEIVAARVPLETAATLLIHADDMTGLVE